MSNMKLPTRFVNAVFDALCEVVQHRSEELESFKGKKLVDSSEDIKNYKCTFSIVSKFFWTRWRAKNDKRYTSRACTYIQQPQIYSASFVDY